VPARNEAVRRARAAGDRQLAAQIAKLRRPTVGAWVINRLAREHPELIEELLALGEALRSAQRDLRGDELRELSVRRRVLVTELSREAIRLARRDRRRDNVPVAEIEATLTAALADPAVAEQVRRGRLTRTVAYTGFGETPRPRLRLVHGGADAERRSAEKAAEAERRAVAAAEAAERRRARAVAHRELLAARTELAEAEAARVSAERAVTAARRRVEKASAALGDLETGESGE
jgi:hypothetical protein